MKMHKYTVYVLDFHDRGYDALEYELENCDLFCASFFNGTGEIGEWDDYHELNSKSYDDVTAEQQKYEKYIIPNIPKVCTKIE